MGAVPAAAGRLDRSPPAIDNGRMIRAIMSHGLPYGIALAALALALAGLRYAAAFGGLDGGVQALVLALLFTGLGLWLGARLLPRAPALPFVRNDAALRQLGISPREVEVLGLLAAGLANKEIARRLGISPNTVKTHVAGLLTKLAASRRTQAIERARALAILP